MKTQRRHELQTNQLADTLAHWLKAIEPYSRAIAAGLVALVVLIFAWGYLNSQSSRRVSDGWTEYLDSGGSLNQREDLASIIERYPGSEVAQWSRVELADIQLSEASAQLFSDKDAARDKLRQAVEKYKSVLAESRQPLLVARAHFGLARAFESLGELENARQEYQSLADGAADAPYAEGARARLKDLEQTSTKQFYDWLAKYEPPPRMTNEPGTPGVRPDFLQEPIDSSLNVPSSLESGVVLPGVGTEAAPTATESPATAPSEGAPRASEPASTAPASTAPASTGPPGDSSPALPAGN